MMYRTLRILIPSFMLFAVPAALFAQGGEGGAPASPMSGLGGMLPMMLIMFGAVWFLMIRPEQKKQKEKQKMLSAVKKGDRVLTTAGILGTVGSVKESTMMIKIADNTVVEFAKSAVTTVLNKDGSDKQAEIAASGDK